MRSIVETTLTNSMTRSWNVRKYGDPNDTNLPRLLGAPFSPRGTSCSLWRLVDYNERTMLDCHSDPWTRMDAVDRDIANLVRPVNENAGMYVTRCWNISELLTRQLKDRMYGIARKLLLVKAQWREEALAADPIKKCAACAVQAAKDQLVLGLEPAAKRVCA